jgi:hypothetical protein
MPAQSRQRSFSAKSQPEPRLGPPSKKRHDDSVRDYLRPDEVDAMVQAARKAGRHRARDGVRNCGCFGSSSVSTPTPRMCSCRSAKHPCRRGPFARSWRKRASWLGCPLSPTPTNCAMRAAITWRLTGMIPEPFRIIWGTRTFNIPCAILRWHLTDLKASRMIKPCRLSDSIGAKPYAKPSRFLAAHCTDWCIRESCPRMWTVYSAKFDFLPTDVARRMSPHIRDIRRPS